MDGAEHVATFMYLGNTEHRTRLYRELNHVLMLIHSPGLGIRAQRIETNVSLIDVLPAPRSRCLLTPNFWTRCGPLDTSNRLRLDR